MIGLCHESYFTSLLSFLAVAMNTEESIRRFTAEV
jgi:hypothetical protein